MDRNTYRLQFFIQQEWGVKTSLSKFTSSKFYAASTCRLSCQSVNDYESLLNGGSCFPQIEHTSRQMYESLINKTFSL